MSEEYTLADYVKGRIPDESLDRICKEADKLQQENLGRIADWSPDYEYDIKCNKTPEEQREIIERAAKLIKKSGFDKTLKKLEEA